MLVKLVEVYKPEGQRLHLDEIYVSPATVLSIRSDNNQTIMEEARTFGIAPEVRFSKVTIQEGGIQRVATIVGSPEELREKLNKRQLLRD
jgi:hypothetical protein